jgi:small subunit ribosomal protein S21
MWYQRVSGPVGSPGEGLSFWPKIKNAEEGGPIVQVVVRDNNVDQALRALKKKMQREGIFREMKLRRSYEKPSEKKAREKAEAIRRARKLARKRMEREGF